MKIIAAVFETKDKKYAIGAGGKLPWSNQKELKYFEYVTTERPPNSKNIVIMGRNTWNSLPPQNKPLKERINVVITSDPSSVKESSVKCFLNLTAAITFKEWKEKIHDIFIIGGRRLFAEALLSCKTTDAYLSQMLDDKLNDIKFDTYFPYEYLSGGRFIESEAIDMKTFVVTHYIRAPQLIETKQVVNVEEKQYLDLVRDILATGTPKSDRTGTGILTKFGHLMKFDLRNGKFPLLTTKRVFWRGVVGELLWMMRGQTDANILSKKGVKIWDANATREFLDKRGLTSNTVGDIGASYGFQWRHFGAKYIDCNTDYKNQGVDQIKYIIDQIRKDPNSRRMLMTAWNPCDLDKMSLPPCHVMCQFTVTNGELSCMMYQRSIDSMVGAPFNIASYALLTNMIAYITNLKPGEFVYSMADCHVYNSHVEAAQYQLLNEPREFPKLKIVPKPDRKIADPAEFEFSDFILEDYHPHESKFKFAMAV